MLFSLAPLAHRPLTFDVGPSTGAYVLGFTPSEERPPTTFRWTRSRATVSLPLHAAGEGRLRLRAARFLDHPSRIHVYAWGRPAGTFEARPGGYRIYELPLIAAPGPLRLDLLSDDPDLGVAVDWIRVEKAGWRVPLAVWGPRVLVAAVFLAGLLAGAGAAPSAAAAGVVALAQATWAALDPFAFAHVATRLGAPAAVFALLLAWRARRWAGGHALVWLFLAGYLLKGAVLFHPAYFYNDTRNNLRYVLALRDGTGSLAERNHSAQVQVGVAYPRVVAGRRYAFPYAPVFFLPFGLLPEDRIVEAIKQVALFCAAAEMVLVFALARLLAAPAVAVAAAAVAVLLPPLYSRLLLAMWSTVAGHFLDTAVIVATVRLAAGPQRARLWMGQAGGTLAAFLTYISSLFNLTLFTGFAALRVRPLAGRLLAGWAAAVTLTLAWLYADFVMLFVREILPAALSGGGMAAEGGARGGGVGEALARIPIFYGWGYPALAAAGFVVLRRGAPARAFGVFAAYALAAVTLVGLRAFGGGLFRDLKEIEFAAPLVAACCGAALAELASRDRAGRIAAALVFAGLAAFSLGRYVEYARTYTSLAGLP